jgi:4-alpha-glucanotransferase
MAFHRLYVIPEGFEATQGAYIRYPCDEFYAIVTLESSRASCLVLGEDLGTVPSEVRKMMQRHQLYRHYVVQYEIAPTSPPLPDIPQKVIASINTHDMPTFTSFWQGNDIQERYNRGLLDNEGVAIESKNRQLVREKVINYLSGKCLINSRKSSTHEVLRGLLALLSSSGARAVMINMEDLWGETQAQNMPGTQDENLNYCRMLRYIFEDFTNLPQVVKTLQDVNDKRVGGNL